MPPQPPLDPQETIGVPREALPRHIAIIMDGNGRWAQRRGLPRIEGHVRGSAAVRAVVTHAARLGIGQLTLYSFSVENWKRPRAEVDALMNLCAQYLRNERDEIRENDIRLTHIGRREELPEAVRRELDTSEALSRGNTGLTLCLALNYGSRAEIVRAVQGLARRVAAGELASDAIDEQVMSASLDTGGMADPDLLVRTAGEMRLSNFLLWQISYAELYVTPVLWPDFGPADLDAAIRAYAGRERRFGDIEPRGRQSSASAPRGEGDGVP
jgi:undecaprenyl diphosphate synthase